MTDRESDYERGALTRLALGGDDAAMALGDAAANCQANPSAFVPVASVQALEDSKNLVEIFLVEADAVVLHIDLALFGIWFFIGCDGERAFDELRPDLDEGLMVRRLKLKRVANKILKQLPHLHRVSFDVRNLTDFNCGFALFDVNFQIAEHAFDDRVAVHFHERL